MENDRVGVTQSSSQQPNAKPEKDEPADKLANTAAIKEPNRTTQPPSTGGNSRRRKACRYTRDPGMFWVAIATFLAVVIYACYARQQAKAATAAAQAAKESADAEVSANRAWIVPSGHKLWMVNKDFMGFEFDWVNAGKTPAVHIRATEEFRTDPKATFKQGCITFDPMKGGEEQFTPYLLPQQTFEITPNIPGEAFAWSEGKAPKIRVHGCIRYVDVLTNSERYTDFCFSVTKTDKVRTVMPCLSSDFGISFFTSNSKWEPIVFR